MRRLDDPYTLPEIEKVCFEKIQLNLGYNFRIDKRHLQGWNLHVNDHDIFYSPVTELSFVLKNFILHGEKKVNKDIKIHLNWWEAFKDEVVYSNKRWYKKYPKIYLKVISVFGKVRHKTIETSTTHMRYCPHIQTDNRCHVEFLQFKDVPYFRSGYGTF